MKQLGTPKGTRDFSSEEVLKREYIINTIKKQFQKFGFNPIETPSFENLNVLTGKYGEEGDRLIFKILNSGDYLKKVSENEFHEKNLKSILPKISEKALRYDLTVPFARYVVNHQNEIAFPFKRYQIQPVWRADRPQKGRYREFYQCDADVIGSNSLWNEVELVQLYDAVFSALKIPTEIHINNRKVLFGLAEVAEIEEQLIDFTVALDKLDKIGEEKVKSEMKSKGISDESIQILQPLFGIKGSFSTELAELEKILSKSETGLKGVEELKFIHKEIENLGLQQSEIKLNTTLARGLNYYTGSIFEVKAKNIELGSIGGGGRYDDLTGIFGLKGMSGVGISFGLDRIYLVLEEKNLFPPLKNNQLNILFLNMGQKEAQVSMGLIYQLRSSGVSTMLYPDIAKLNKQFKYADKVNVEFTALVGEEELKNDSVVIKNMQSGEQEVLKTTDLIQRFKNK